VNEKKFSEIKEYIQVMSIQKSKGLQTKKSTETRNDKNAEGRHGCLYVATEVQM